MTSTEPSRPPPGRSRPTLTEDVIVMGAIELADRIGIADLTIRRLAEHLGSKPMTLYHHVANKQEILDAMTDAVFAEIGPPAVDQEWKSAMRDRCERARAVFRAHPWAVPLMDSTRSPGPATLGHHDAMIGCLRNAGFTMAAVAHTVSLLDAYVFGFAIQEANLPATAGEEMHDLLDQIAIPVDLYPNLAAFTAEHVMVPDYDFGEEFDLGLGLVLDAVEERYAGT